MLTAWTGDFLKAIGDIRLGPQIKIHVGIHRETVSTLEADATAFPIRLQGSSVDAERVGLADCTAYAGQAFFYLLERCVSHEFPLMNEQVYASVSPIFNRFAPRTVISLTRSRPSLYYGTMHMINKRLLVGNADDANNPPPQVGAVLMVAEEQNVTVPSRIVSAKIPLKEFGEPSVATLSQAIEWMEAHIANHRLMVCCRVGMGRSVSVVIAFLCCVEGMSYGDAVKLVLTRRPGGMPLPQLEKVIEDLRHRRKCRRDPLIP